jgi:hypothetical protein
LRAPQSTTESEIVAADLCGDSCKKLRCGRWVSKVGSFDRHDLTSLPASCHPARILTITRYKSQISVGEVEKLLGIKRIVDVSGIRRIIVAICADK